VDQFWDLCEVLAPPVMISNMKRTTLILHERRLLELKRLAAERGQTLSALVDQFLAEGLRHSCAPKRRAPALPVFDMGEPRVNIADRDQLFDAMERE
jgi:hypothetical protein